MLNLRFSLLCPNHLGQRLCQDLEGPLGVGVVPKAQTVSVLSNGVSGRRKKNKDVII
jgi:hypothetical protein